GRDRSACNREGNSPEVDVQTSAAAGAAASISARIRRFSSSRSGTLSWITSAPATASSIEAAKDTEPRRLDASVSRDHARSALASTSPTSRSASGAGSKRTQSTPFSTSLPAQPPPITPPPTSATRNSAPLHELQPLAHLARTEHADVHRLEDRHRPPDERAVRRPDAAREPEVVLEAHADVAPGQNGHGDVGQLHPADREGREDAAGRQVLHQREQRRRVVGSSVRDAQAELDQRRLVDEPLGEQLLREDEVPGVE